MGKLKIKTKYGIIPNTVLNSSDLSLKAKGLYGYLQSKPDGWNFSISRISAQMKDGKSAIQNAIQELETNGYLVREPIRNKTGFDGYDYILSENVLTQNQSTGFLSTQNYVALSKKENSKQDVVRKKERAPSLKTWKSEALLINPQVDINFIITKYKIYNANDWRRLKDNSKITNWKSLLYAILADAPILAEVSQFGKDL